MKRDLLKEQKVQKVLDCLLNQAIREKVTPGAVAAVSCQFPERTELQWCASAGRTAGIFMGGREVTKSTFYDLASLTKPLVTVLLVMILMEEKKMELTTPLGDLLPETVLPKDKQSLQLGQLLAHRTGLPAHRAYFVDLLGVAPGLRKKTLVEWILAEHLTAPPNLRHCYSDLGYILLGEVIEQLSGMSVDRYYHEKVLEPLELTSQLWFAPGARKDPSSMDEAGIAATEVCPWTHRLLCGEVHDDNCRVVGGVAGHAGLFGTVDGVMTICRLLLRLYRGEGTPLSISSSLLKGMSVVVGDTTWASGFDTPSKSGSSSGRHFSSETIGHLGFSGTSFWIDLARGIIVVLLTNRVHPSRTNTAIRWFRPRFHDGIMEALLEE